MLLHAVACYCFMCIAHLQATNGLQVKTPYSHPAAQAAYLTNKNL